MSAAVPVDDSALPVKELLGNVPIFGALGDRALEQVQKLLKVHRFEAGAFVVREGDTDKNVYIVEHGEVEVLKTCGGPQPNVARIAVLGSGACFGEMSLIDVMPRSASVRTTRPSQFSRRGRRPGLTRPSRREKLTGAPGA